MTSRVGLASEGSAQVLEAERSLRLSKREIQVGEWSDFHSLMTALADLESRALTLKPAP